MSNFNIFICPHPSSHLSTSPGPHREKLFEDHWLRPLMQIHSREGQLSHGLLVIESDQPGRVACGWFTNPNRWYSWHNHIIQPHLLYIQYTYNIHTIYIQYTYNIHTIYIEYTYNITIYTDANSLHIYIYTHYIYKTIFALYMHIQCIYIYIHVHTKVTLCILYIYINYL